MCRSYVAKYLTGTINTLRLCFRRGRCDDVIPRRQPILLNLSFRFVILLFLFFFVERSVVDNTTQYKAQ
jgi:hypothetical protein